MIILTACDYGLFTGNSNVLSATDKFETLGDNVIQQFVHLTGLFDVGLIRHLVRLHTQADKSRPNTARHNIGHNYTG